MVLRSRGACATLADHVREQTMVQTRHYNLENVFDADSTPGVFGKVATQLMCLHQLVRQFDSPLVLECGVNEGWSSGVLAHACELQAGRLVSLDIADCSAAIDSEVWTFIQTDDADLDFVLSHVPELERGIDIVYIDSLHSPRHVAKLTSLYYPLVKQGGYLAFDDVDPGPFMQGRRKDNANMEVVWRGIADAVLDFFHANEDDLLLEFHFGSTGLAIMKKLAQIDKLPQPARRLRRRSFTLRSLARQLLTRR
ncbi:MAG: class I SAM-dependent methyltransferase [Anaerolineae bacterium]|nr:class I SAM-dependent methyltransferase [Anaerolineae bacterium]